jgi:hypothetical protein
MGFLSSLFGVDDAQKAINKAAKKSSAEQTAAYGDISSLYSPYVHTGGRAFNTLADLSGINGQGAADNAMGMFQTSPGYQFRFNEGIRAIDNSGAARGNLFSGSTLKALTNYGQGVGSQEYGNWTNSLANLGNVGYGATSATAGARGNLAGNLTNIYTNQGAQNANASLAGGNLLMGGLNTLAGLAGYGMSGGFGLGSPRPATAQMQQPIMVSNGGQPYYW